MAVFFYETDIGTIGIEEKNGFISNVYFGKDNMQNDIEIKETKLLKEASIQLNKYIKGELKEFNLPLSPKGTEFMNEVWARLCEIPYGEVLTYKEMGEKVGRPKAARAVGLACNRNPIPIFIPCHRIVGSSGKLTGYLGGIDIKEKLLNLEKNNK
ncbi:methylated-DNA--[protein]-cysteine S-methyltransferase [Clostridium sardiniense]|uniref:methylated-DNA--[protein]-cysteine S-methyltransferase n=1 Tax=Clostridium sardiniense TaxID=29369 RepID=UPI003D352F15